MSSYTKAVIVPTNEHDAANARMFRVVGGFEYDIGYLGSPTKVIVEDGFLTNLASIPWLLRWLYKPYLRALALPATVHDKLRADLRYGLTDGNAIFLAAMRDAPGVPLWVAWACFAGVNLSRSRAP